MPTPHHAKVIDQFTRTAPAFASAPQFTDLQALDLLRNAARATADDESLDVACGAGVVAVHFARTVRHATGIDLTPAMLAKARERQAASGLRNLRWDEGDAARLPYADGRFSIVTSRFAIHHVQEPLRVVGEMVRVCRPGGRIAIADISLPDDPEAALAFNRAESRHDPSHVAALTASQWMALAGQAGLEAWQVARYQIELPLHRLLQAGQVPADEAARIEQDMLRQRYEGPLAFCLREAEGRCRFVYPIAVMAAAKPFAP